jgi:hypothetical protein
LIASLETARLILRAWREADGSRTNVNPVAMELF